MIYNDIYHGNTVETGQELVSIDLVNRWSNEYYGGTIKEKLINLIDKKDITIFPQVISAFLKQALKELPKDFPVRGPLEYSINNVQFEDGIYNGEWQYKNKLRETGIYKIDDPFVSFVGEEEIFYNGTKVYIHNYHGGVITDKYFPVELDK